MANQIEVVEKNCQINPTLEDRLLKCANGSYQLGLLMGWNRWSGSNLKGKALHWKYKYNQSAMNLLNRIKQIGSDHQINFELKSQLNENKRWQVMLVATPIQISQVSNG